MKIETDHLFNTIFNSGDIILSEYNSNIKNQEFIPVIIGDNKNIAFLTDHIENSIDDLIEENDYEGEDKDILKLAFEESLPICNSINSEKWFEKRLDNDISNTQLNLPINETNITNDKLSSFLFETNGSPKKDIGLALLPINYSWQIPLFLRLGDWNTCPKPYEHSAILKYWENKYGAKVLCISNNTIELLVENPPETPEEAFILAKEHIAYCDTLFVNGLESLYNLTSNLINNKNWFFWWD